MILALLLACHPKKVDTGIGDTGRATSDTSRDTSTTTETDTQDTGPLPVSSCPAKKGWREVARLEDPTAPRFATALATGGGHVWILGGEIDSDFSDGAVVVYHAGEDGLTEMARLDHADAIPFVYSATVDAAGDLWMGGMWYRAAESSRKLLVVKYSVGTGTLTTVAEDDPEVTDERASALAATDDAVWAAGRGVGADGVTRWRVWRIGEDVVVSDMGPDDEGSVAGTIATDGTTLWVGGSSYRDGVANALIRTGGDSGFSTALDSDIQPGAQDEVSDIAVDAAGQPWFTTTSVTEAGPGGWAVWQGVEAPVQVDEVSDTTAESAHLAVGGWAWAGGARTSGGARIPYLRGGDPEWDVTFEGVEKGFFGEIHLLETAADGSVWATTSEQALDGSVPTRSRVICRSR